LKKEFQGSLLQKSKRTVLLFISPGPEVIGDHGRNIRTGQHHHHHTQQTDSATTCQQQRGRANRAIATSCSVTVYTTVTVAKQKKTDAGKAG
jgi:hypothetical protein